MNLKFLKIFIITVIISSAALFSCTREENSNPSEIDRSEFLVGKNSDEIRTSFRELSVDDKFALWDNKLEQLLTQKLPTNQLDLIKELKVEMNNVRTGNQNRFQEIAINLAETIPEQDFILMFSNLSDYKFSGKFNSKTFSPNYVIEDLRNLKLHFEKANNHDLNNSVSKKPECSCRWSCWMTGGQSTGNCIKTDGGCGFLLIQDCTHYPG